MNLKSITIAVGLFSAAACLITAASAASVPASTRLGGSLTLDLTRIAYDATKPGTGNNETETQADFAWKAHWKEQLQWGNRTGVLGNDGVLLVRAGDKGWVAIAHNVASFQLMDNRVAVLKKDGTLLYAEGVLSTPFKKIGDGVVAYQMTHTRVGLLTRDGTFYLREVGFLPQRVAHHVRGFHVLDDRVALLDGNGALWLQDGGSLTKDFYVVARAVEHFQLDGRWVAYTSTASGQNVLMAGRKPLSFEAQPKSQTFSEYGRNVRDFELEVTVDLGAPTTSRAHLAMVDATGSVHIGESVKDGNTIPLAAVGVPNAQSVAWAGRQLLILTADDRAIVNRIEDDSGSRPASCRKAR